MTSESDVENQMYENSVNEEAGLTCPSKMINMFYF